MEFSAMRDDALAVRARYEQYERERFGRPWTLEELALGLMGDVGDLARLIQARVGVRDIESADAALGHELADVLWSVIVIAERCGVDLEAAFATTMAELAERLA